MSQGLSGGLLGRPDFSYLQLMLAMPRNEGERSFPTAGLRESICVVGLGADFPL
jgi:hypothetical protein